MYPRTCGGKKTPTYNTWEAMNRRCYDPKFDSYQKYGAKGVTVCKRWRKSFDAFVEDMGGRPTEMTLDRIDGTKGYKPKNCRWATIEVQNNNQKERGVNANSKTGIRGLTKLPDGTYRFRKYRKGKRTSHTYSTIQAFHEDWPESHTGD